VIALLTILGYSIYDGIVVFDKVEENTRGLAATGRMGYGDVVNLSLNEVLMRSLNTSITALLPILSLLVLGGYVLGAATLKDFALALLVGLAASAYSSIFIASPLLAILKEREPRYRALRQRLESRGGASGTGLLTPAAAGGGVGPLPGDSTGGERVAAEMPRPEPGTAASRYGNAPRPRKRRRR
ncbi:MAG: protein translocase subunit SecF, partial [Acidimicrobiia bacterium]